MSEFTIDAESAADIAKFDVQLARYLAGELEEDVFRVFRLNNGIYGQRQGGHNQMIRIKAPYGTITAAQLDRMGDLATRFSTVFDDHRREASKRTCAVFEFLDHGLFSVCDEEFWEMGHITSEGFWDDPSVREGKEFEEDRHHSGHRGEAKWNHEDAALGEKLPDEVDAEKMSHREDGVEESVHG
jgi:hypothetical protein